MIYAKPSTSLVVVFRAYLASDHVTPATGKTIAITISKNGGAFGNPNAGATNATEMSSGFYKVTLDTTDTGTAGPLAVRGAVATVDDVGAIFYVGQAPSDVTHWLGTAAATPTVAGVPEVDITHFGGTAATTAAGRPEVNATHFAGTAYATALAAEVDAVWDEVLTAAAHNVASSAGKRLRLIDGAFEVHAGTASAGAAGTITLEAGTASAVNDIYNGDRIIITEGTGAGEHGLVVDYDGTTKVATMSKNWVVTPDNTSVYEVVPADCDVETWNHLTVVELPLVPTTAGRKLDVSAGGEAGVDWANVGSPTTVVGLSGTTVKTATDVETDTADIQTRIPAVLVSGRMDASVGAMANNTITASAIATDAIDGDAVAADAVTKIQNGLATPTNITAGTITTVTNLTNAPTNGDLTATMKTSVTTAATAATPIAASVTGAVGSVAGNVTGSVGSLAAQAKADVNAEVLDVLNTDTFAEPGKEAPAATNTLAKKIGYLFKFLRNKVEQTATTLSVYDDAGTTVDQQATVSDDATTYTRGEIGSGP